MAAGQDTAFYSARVPVSDRSDQQLQSAAKTALENVLVRVTGDEQIADNPRMAAAIASARDHLALYRYQPGETDLRVHIQFDEATIQGLLRDAEAMFWSAERPPVLLWIVVDEPYSRRFGTMADDRPLITALATEFQRRGVNLRLPLLDLEDAANLTLNMVWQRALPEIRAASARYGAEHILVARAVQLTSGRYIFDWLYLDPDTQLTLQNEGDDLALLLPGAVDMAVDAMAARYAVRLAPSAPGEGIEVAVTGVVTSQDYADIMAELGALPTLQGMRVLSIKGDELTLQVRGVRSAEQMARLLPRYSRLVPAGMPSQERLLLRWGRP
jgi:hypothetical protein